jgi:hypothetical protein
MALNHAPDKLPMFRWNSRERLLEPRVMAAGATPDAQGLVVVRLKDDQRIRTLAHRAGREMAAGVVGVRTMAEPERFNVGKHPMKRGDFASRLRHGQQHLAFASPRFVRPGRRR